VTNPFDIALGFFDVVGTAFGQRAKGLLVTLAGARGTTLDDSKGEKAPNQQAWNAGTLAVLANPLDGTTSGTPLRAGVVGARTADGVVPLAWKDPRIDRAFPNGVPKGTVALAGYGKAFHSIGVVDASDPNTSAVHTLYAPFEFDADGVPTKAHAIVIDTTPGKTSIQLVHADGYFLQLQEGKGIRGAVDDSTFFQMKPGVFSVQAASINLQGNVALGADTSIAVPLLGGSASPPGPSVFISPV
jgi:hypothetical protein